MYHCVAEVRLLPALPGTAGARRGTGSRHGVGLDVRIGSWFGILGLGSLVGMLVWNVSSGFSDGIFGWDVRVDMRMQMGRR